MREEGWDWKRAVVETFLINEAVNQHLLRHLDGRAWRAEVPGYRGKNIATTFAHMHNCRLMWLTMADKRIARFGKLDRARATMAQVRASLAKSAKALGELLKRGTEHPQGKVKQMPPNVIVAMAYILTHEAHHRGQVMLMARQAGYPVELMDMAGMWQWGKMLKGAGGNIR